MLIQNSKQYYGEYTYLDCFMKDNLSNDSENRKILSILSHGSILFGSTIISIGVPIAILLLSEDPIVKASAKEALNFYISCYILAIIFICLIFVLIGFPLLFLLLIASWIMPVIAIIKIAENPDRIYRYPLTLRLL